MGKYLHVSAYSSDRQLSFFLSKLFLSCIKLFTRRKDHKNLQLFLISVFIILFSIPAKLFKRLLSDHISLKF